MSTTQELEMMGYTQRFDYTQYSHDNDVNIIPEQDFKRLVADTFKTIVDVMRETYGPYGSTMMIADQGETMTTKDGHNVFEVIHFGHQYKRLVYLAIKKICDRVNQTVGDGTTSCILLADHMFNKLNELVQSKDDKRQILSVLSYIEQNLTDVDILESDINDDLILPLTSRAFDKVINMASNYDSRLTDVLVNAMCPTIDENDDTITDIRNVVVETNIDRMHESSTEFIIDHLPGNYRIRVMMESRYATLLANKTDAKIALFDHTFSDPEWAMIRDISHGNKIVVIAPAINRQFMDGPYRKYLEVNATMTGEIDIILVTIKGSFVRDEIKDLAAVLRCEPYGLHTNHKIEICELPEVMLEVYKGNCMCFHDVEAPTDYIEHVRKDMYADKSGSYATRKNYLDRIRALEMKTKDTLVTINTGTMLEAKMLADKIDDCVSIINSAFINGIVPNMFRYGYNRIERIDKSDTLTKNTLRCINEAIRELFKDIWNSKYDEMTDELTDQMNITCCEFYEKWASYDIISHTYHKLTDLPTSAQYDLEVIVAAISIVKYLLSSRGFIFDSHLLQTTGDHGHFQLV